MLRLILPGWLKCPEKWEKATLITGKMSGKNNLFNVARCGNLFYFFFFSVPSIPIAVQLCANCIQLCTQMSSWAVLTSGQDPWWVVFFFKEQKITWFVFSACGLQHHQLEYVLLI